jgi:hypothetical protein
MNSDGVDDFFLFYGVDEGDHSFEVTPLNGGQTIVQDPYGFPWTESVPMTAGTEIGATPDAPLYWGSSTMDLITWYTYEGGVSEGVGPWAGVANGYMGVSFSVLGDTYYGWVQMTVSDEGPYAYVQDWAYNTIPGEGILAGQVPEPAAGVLFLVGAFAATVFHRLRARRRRIVSVP